MGGQVVVFMDGDAVVLLPSFLPRTFISSLKTWEEMLTAPQKTDLLKNCIRRNFAMIVSFLARVSNETNMW